MRKRLAFSLVAVAAVILLVFSIPLSFFLSNVERDRLVTALERDAFILAGHAKETLNTTAGSVLPSLQPYVNQYDMKDDPRVIVVNAEGLVVSTNDMAVALGTSFVNRPEVAQALTGVPSVGERDSRTLGEPLIYVAVPVLLGDDVLGAVRLSHPESHIDSAVRSRLVGIGIAGLITLIAAAIISIPLALGIARPIERLTRRTEKLAEGDFSVRADDSVGPPEVRELSRSFNTMAGRLGLLIDGQRQFASAVSHQLRTPLTALRLRLEQAQDALGNGNPIAHEALEASRAETDRLQEMVEQLLALARIEGRAAAVAKVDAVEVVSSRAEMWMPLAGERGIDFVVDAPSSAVCVAIDGALEQMVDNYIDNALTVAPDGSSIVLRVTRSGDKTFVDVCDSGPGLSDQELALAFERFWRGKHTENSPGTGLGLAIVKQLAVASGGDAKLMHHEDGQPGVVARVVLVNS
jgi:signal transduction histidine kinase